MKLKVITALAAAAGSAVAQISGDTVKIDMITDMSGVYADLDGGGGAEAARMAIADFGGNLNGRKIKFLAADHQNKADGVIDSLVYLLKISKEMRLHASGHNLFVRRTPPFQWGRPGGFLCSAGGLRRTVGRRWRFGQYAA